MRLHVAVTVLECYEADQAEWVDKESPFLVEFQDDDNVDDNHQHIFP